MGVDISTSSIKLVELGRHGANHRLERFAIEPLPANAVVENAVADVDEVGIALQRAMRRAGSRRKCAAVSIASSHVISKVIGMPGGLKPKELEDQVEAEADHYVPYPLDEVNIDFEVLGPSTDNPNEDDVLLTACRKEIADGAMAAIERAGMIPSIIDVDAYAIENLFPVFSKQLAAEKTKRTVAILDFGAVSTRINIIHDGRSTYTRDQAFGGRRVFEEIQQRFGLSDEEIRHMQYTGDIPGEYQIEVVQPFVQSVAQEAARALQFFFSSSRLDSVDHVFLIGGCARYAGVDQAVSELTGFPTSIMNPFAGMTLSSRVKKQLLQWQAPALAVASGLALRGFDE